ncbi:MAG: diaminopimelate decarboxylase [Clostridia bacterium]|nr:diaminopimelate decarboxylase [Clostridia bacterium]
MICNNLSINEKGHLTFAGRDTVELAEKYSTPLYLLDEDKIREKCRIYKNAMARFFGENSLPLYAGKALCIKDIYRIMREENMGIDVVSSGEIYTASAGGFPMENAYFHGNNKTDTDIAFAMDMGVGYFVCDSATELLAIENEAAKRDTVQNILLRITPGIDPHTHQSINTGRVDSKFGAAIETGQAKELVSLALSKNHLKLCGYHCHIGSQIFEAEPFTQAAEIMLGFSADIKDSLGFEADILNLGGGMGVRYLSEQPDVPYEDNISAIADKMRSVCQNRGLKFPSVRMEPGRSIVAESGMTLYTAGTVKTIPGFKNYLSVDGGMPDNPRYALYQSPYTVSLANRMNDECDFVCTVAGRCCESGDLIQENVSMPTPRRGDIVAVMTTGAYNYSMASNYNRIPRPPVVILRDGEDRLIVRRETFEDMLSLEI